jgi:thiamine biosynthesis lipoprotein
MGTRVRIVFYAESAEIACKAAFAEIAAVDTAMSDYKPESEISRLSREAGKGPQPVSEALYAVLQAAQRTAELSGGAFDVTIGPLVRLWRRSRDEGRLPLPEEIRAAKDLVDYRKLLLDPVKRTVTLEKPGMLLDVGGIAKGYGCDRALAALASLGIHRAMVDAGGGMALGDPPPGAPGWKIGMIGDSHRMLILSRCGVATAGDLEQFVEIDGIRYSHIMDPVTGVGLTNRAMATVIARNGLLADAFDTPICILGAERGFRMVSHEPGTEAWTRSDHRRPAETAGFAKFTAEREPSPK